MTCMFAPSHAILSTHHSISKVASLVNIYYVIQRNYFKKLYYVFYCWVVMKKKTLLYFSPSTFSDIVKPFGTADNACNISVTFGWNNNLFSIRRLNCCLIITCSLGWHWTQFYRFTFSYTRKLLLHWRLIAYTVSKGYLTFMKMSKFCVTLIISQVVYTCGMKDSLFPVSLCSIKGYCFSDNLTFISWLQGHTMRRLW